MPSKHQEIDPKHHDYDQVSREMPSKHHEMGSKRNDYDQVSREMPSKHHEMGSNRNDYDQVSREMPSKHHEMGSNRNQHDNNPYLFNSYQRNKIAGIIKIVVVSASHRQLPFCTPFFNIMPPVAN